MPHSSLPAASTQPEARQGPQGAALRQDAGLARSTHCWVKAVEPHLEQTPAQGMREEGSEQPRLLQGPAAAWELSPAFLSFREHEVPTLPGLCSL